MDVSEVKKLAKSLKSSRLEEDFLTHWKLLFPTLPPPERQVRFHPFRRWRWDFSWEMPKIKLAVECQGGAYMRRSGHNTAFGQSKDYEKWREGVRLGWKILPFNTADMRQMEDVVTFVAEVLCGVN